MGRSHQVQGWKLHISSRPVEALALISILAPFFGRQDVCFKCARNSHVLQQLNEGALGATQIGKFVTIYPESNACARALAEMLVELTKGFNGPVVVTDIQIGDVLYARYGAHNPEFVRDRLGQIVPSIRGPDGQLQADSYNVPFRLPRGIQNPFEGMVRSRAESSIVVDDAGRSVNRKSDKLFGPGYLVLEVIKQHPKGSVFKGIDLRAQEGVSVKIIKQGRRHCLSDEYGRDIRSRLRRQYALHQLLHSSVSIPKVDAYFEVDGDGYLSLDYIEGDTLESMTSKLLNRRPWCSVPICSRRWTIDVLDNLLKVTNDLHEAGYVHRDLTASNVLIGVDDRVYLLDLELIHARSDISPAFGVGTPGFMSPQQERREQPATTDDIYSLGCIFIFAWTGTDPRRVLFAGERQRFRQLTEFVGATASELAEVTAQAVLAVASDRPTIADMRRALLRADLQVASVARARVSMHKDRIASGLMGILRAAPRDPQTGVWLSPPLENATHHVTSQGAAALELRRSASRGVAGVVYLLSRAARLGYGTGELRNSVQAGVEWLIGSKAAPDAGMPGLHFGEAGVAVAISEAIAASLVNPTAEISKFINQCLGGSLDWPDFTHGAAGQGVAAFCCADLLREQAFAEPAHAAANYLVKTQQPDGSWVMPSGVEGMSGETLTGFAHGVAGMVFFLAEYDRRYNSKVARSSWQAGLTWLESRAIPVNRAVEWEYSDTRSTRWRWWCHGGPGIALTFLRLYELTRDEQFATFARKALRIHPVRVLYQNLTQCHGLSGLGDVYLEAARVLGDHTWTQRASNIVRSPASTFS